MRERAGLTQMQLATMMDMQLSAIQKIEYQQNKSMPYSTLEKLCEILDCEPGDLLERRPN